MRVDLFRCSWKLWSCSSGTTLGPAADEAILRRIVVANMVAVSPSSVCSYGLCCASVSCMRWGRKATMGVFCGGGAAVAHAGTRYVRRAGQLPHYRSLASWQRKVLPLPPKLDSPVSTSALPVRYHDFRPAIVAADCARAMALRHQGVGQDAGCESWEHEHEDVCCCGGACSRTPLRPTTA